MEGSTLIPVEEYLSTSYRPDREYVDGTLVERNVGEWDHSELRMALSAYLFNRRRELNIHVLPEQRVQVKATRFRVPDVCVVTGDEPREQILTSPPFLCVEILSKDDRMSEMQERIDDYLSFNNPKKARKAALRVRCDRPGRDGSRFCRARTRESPSMRP